MSKENSFKWKYASIGGVVRVKIDSGEAIAHLGELDQKKWTVLSCPTKGLEFDAKTLEMLDTDCDGRIRVCEVVAASKWLTSVVKDKDLLLKGDSVLPLDQIDDSKEEGARLKKSALQILKNLGKDGSFISIEDASDTGAIYANTKFNGDGVITPASSDDEKLAKVIQTCMDTCGSVPDISGAPGVNREKVEAFYSAAADYVAWCDDAVNNKDVIFPYGDNTEAALAACEALKDKIADYFLRCKLISFDDKVADAVDVSAGKVAAIGDRNLVSCMDEISTYPLARPSGRAVLPFDAVNPAWKAAFDNLKAVVFDVEFKGATEINEDQWSACLAKFAAFSAWKAGKKGASVEAIGIDFLKECLSDGSKEGILELIAKDQELEEEMKGIINVNKLLHLYRDFYKYLNNYVVFSDFYTKNPQQKAIFEAGVLLIDERCCELCIKVDNMGAHADMANLSGMFLIYCTCTSKTLGKSMDIVAVMTDGNTKNLRPGKNGIFYDRAGNDWDAVVTKIVDNPINIRQAFFAPYRKLWNFLTEKLNKSASEKESAAISGLQSKVDNVKVTDLATAPKPAFDIAKFAGIFAAIGMAIGFIGQALVSLATGISSNPWWQTLLAVVGIMLVISGPSCFLAWNKLRKRDLGPVLNANGWAINSLVKVNSIFGKTLTSVAKYPIIKMKDPYVKKSPWGKICGVIVALLAIFAILFFTTDGFSCAEKEQAPLVESVDTASVDIVVE